MKTRRTLGFALSLVSVAGVNFIPLEMWLHDDFSGAQSMILYWLENILAIFLAIVFVFLFAPRRDETAKFGLAKTQSFFIPCWRFRFRLRAPRFSFISSSKLWRAKLICAPSLKRCFGLWVFFFWNSPLTL